MLKCYATIRLRFAKITGQSKGHKNGFQSALKNLLDIPNNTLYSRKVHIIMVHDKVHINLAYTKLQVS